VTRYVEERREAFGVEPICGAIGVPVSTYYARRSRKPSARALAERELVREIYAAREGYRSVYGVRKTWRELRRRGVGVGRDQVARLMRQEGLEGVRRGKKRWTTIVDEAALERARDLLQRDFAATRPNEKWVADITYIRTWTGFVYLAFILDCHSRMIVGWQLASHMRTDLVLDALRMALHRREPGADVELIHHSDRGSQYTSIDYTQTLSDHRVLASVGSIGDAYDNALAESFVDSFKTELIADRVWRSRSQLELAVVEYIGWYNAARLHESLGHIPPLEYEQQHAEREPITLAGAMV
jgi:transposase InsO family protein